MWAHKTHPDWLTAGTGAGQISWAVTRWSGSWWGGWCHNELHYELHLHGSVGPVQCSNNEWQCLWQRQCVPNGRLPRKEDIYSLWSFPLIEIDHLFNQITNWHIFSLTSVGIQPQRWCRFGFLCPGLRYPSEISASAPTQRRGGILNMLLKEKLHLHIDMKTVHQ